MELPPLHSGIYRHYKNHYYLVLGYGHDANDESRITVSYVGLELDDARTGPRISTRTAVSDDPKVDAWWDFVHEDGTKCTHLDTTQTCKKGFRIKPRFEYIGTSWQGYPKS